MYFIAWNCRGLGSLKTVDSLHDMVKRESPPLIFLVEIKCSAHEMMRIKRRHRKSLWLALLWIDEVNIGLRRWVTGVYGWLEGAHKQKTWRMIQDLNTEPDLP
ncbi:N-acetyldiaminopimelate deacetylase [Bienertia sinuspersici]